MYVHNSVVRPPAYDQSGGLAGDIGKSPDGFSFIGRSVFEALDHVMSQVEYQCFTEGPFNHIDPLFKELCLVIAEVLVLCHDSTLKVNGALISAHIVQDVFFRIRNDHIRLVFNNFRCVTQRIVNKKAYLRTALYNSIFEIESHFVNAFVCDGV